MPAAWDCTDCPNKGNSARCVQTECLCFSFEEWYIDELADQGEVEALRGLAKTYRVTLTHLKERVAKAKALL